MFTSPIVSFLVYVLKNGLGAQTSTQMFSDVALIQIIRSIARLVSGTTALHRSLVMFQDSGRSLLVSASVLISIFTYEFQSEYSFDIFLVILSLLVLVNMKLPNYNMLNKLWFTNFIVCFIKLITFSSVESDRQVHCKTAACKITCGDCKYPVPQAKLPVEAGQNHRK